MELACGIFTPASSISDDDIRDIGVLLGCLSDHAPRVSPADLLEVAIESHLFVVSDLDAPRGNGYRIVAMATLVIQRTLMGRSGYVHDVVVDEAYRGKGIAERLNRRLIEEAQRLGMRHIDLTSGPEREAANRLYLKLGYERRATNVYRKKLDGSTSSPPA